MFGVDVGDIEPFNDFDCRTISKYHLPQLDGTFDAVLTDQQGAALDVSGAFTYDLHECS